MNSTCRLAFLWLVALAACQQGPSATALSAADSAAIRETSQRWIAAVRAGRWDAAAATYTDDAIVWFPDATFVGRTAIRKLFETMRPFSATRMLEIDEIQGRGDLAFVAGHSTDSIGGARIVVARYLDIRRRQPDGTWLFYRDMVSPVPLAAAQPAVAADKRR